MRGGVRHGMVHGSGPGGPRAHADACTHMCSYRRARAPSTRSGCQRAGVCMGEWVWHVGGHPARERPTLTRQDGSRARGERRRHRRPEGRGDRRREWQAARHGPETLGDGRQGAPHRHTQAGRVDTHVCTHRGGRGLARRQGRRRGGRTRTPDTVHTHLREKGLGPSAGSTTGAHTTHLHTAHPRR